MKHLLYFLLLLTTRTAFTQSDNEFTVPLSNPAKRGKLKVHINYGSITVKGTARKDVLIRYAADQEEPSEKKEARNGLRRISGGAVDLEASENENFVKVSSDSWSKKINIEVEVPNGMDLQLHTYNDGDINVTSVQGDLEINNYNGEIHASNISGSIVASTFNGEIKATFDNITEGAPMSFSTYNGDIDLTFPGTLKASLKLNTQQGEVLSDFDVSLVKSGPVQKKDTRNGVYKVVVDEWVKGDISGGGPEFMMKTYNGDIIIRKK